MSARAAARLETLGFRHVYRYQPGKADWFAAGLAREGTEADTPRVADTAQRDVVTCGADERVGAVRDRVRERGTDVCVVVDGGRVVLGLVQAAMLDADPDVRVGQLPEYLTTHRTLAVVTTSDGVLVGRLRFDEQESGGP